MKIALLFALAFGISLLTTTSASATFGKWNSWNSWAQYDYDFDYDFDDDDDDRPKSWSNSWYSNSNKNGLWKKVEEIKDKVKTYLNKNDDYCKSWKEDCKHKPEVVPSPAAFSAGLMGLAAVGMRRRRQNA